MPCAANSPGNECKGEYSHESHRGSRRRRLWFKTAAYVNSEDNQHVAFDVKSDCEKIAALGAALRVKGLIDAYQEISPVSESVVMQTVRSVLTGCCAGCAVPAGLFKAMQVAAGSPCQRTSPSGWPKTE